MSTHRIASRRRSARTLLASVAVVMVLGGTVACSSSSDSKIADKSSSGSKSKSGSKSQELPEGFPDDVPLPEFEKVSVLMNGAANASDVWSVMVIIDANLKESSESLMAAYTAQLEGAGYELKDEDGSNVEAENDKWEIAFHSSADGTLTIGISPR